MTTKTTKAKAPKAANIPGADKPARAPRTKNPVAGAKVAARTGAQEQATPPAAERPQGLRGKIATMLGLMRRPEGATIPHLMDATGWQAHSVRGAIAGVIKKKLGLAVTSTKTETGRIYRIETADDAG